ncbi:MAG TPA: hypothetical protein DD435_08515 [Cyanobacteria bacterium UBA8530]|nr:hypothetical protein [Cyanobacteria bacterium UBA8530]
MKVELLHSTPEGEALIARTGIFYGERSTKNAIRSLMQKGKEAAFEHWRACFRLEAEPRSLLKELLIPAPLLKLTQPILSEGDDFVLSGNARAFRRLIEYASAYPLACRILTPLWEKSNVLFCPEIFPPFDPEEKKEENFFLPKESRGGVSLWSLFHPAGLSKGELLVHGSATFCLTGISQKLSGHLLSQSGASGCLDKEETLVTLSFEGWLAGLYFSEEREALDEIGKLLAKHCPPLFDRENP